jgi:hypothetical protein
MTRHIGAFIQNTVKPMIEELDKVLGKCENLKIDKEELQKIFANLLVFEMFKTVVYCATYVFLGLKLCQTLLRILL